MFRLWHFPLVALALLFLASPVQNARAADDSGQGQGQRGWRGGGGGGGGNRAQFILKHADDLTLTDDQKTKLEALAKENESAPPSPENAAAQKEKLDAILTDAQRDKLKDIFRARMADRTAGNGKDAVDLPLPPQPPPVPHIEDKVHGADLLSFILSHDTELFLRADQKELFDPLTKASAQPDATLKKTIWDILTGQQIGKLREMLKKHPELQTLGLAPAPATAETGK